MGITAKIDPIDRDIQLILKDELSPAARQAALVSFARTQLAAAQETNARALGAVPPHETIVDARRGAALESVQPDGTIVFEFTLLDDLFAWIGEQLVRHAPVLTGRYRDSFLFFADGTAVDPGGAVPPASEYTFLNSRPYSRKLERGLSDQAPDGVFQVVAALAAKRFGNLARIRFSYRTLAGSPKDRATRQPAIVISLR